jgi:hypothetical protein
VLLGAHSAEEKSVRDEARGVAGPRSCRCYSYVQELELCTEATTGEGSTKRNMIPQRHLSGQVEKKGTERRGKDEKP